MACISNGHRLVVWDEDRSDYEEVLATINDGNLKFLSKHRPSASSGLIAHAVRGPYVAVWKSRIDDPHADAVTIISDEDAERLMVAVDAAEIMAKMDIQD